MTSDYENVKLLPCPSCHGQPVVLIRPGWPYPVVRIVCSSCGKEGVAVYYCPEGDKVFQGYGAYEKRLLPGLAKARRQAAAAWNEEAGSDG